MIQGLSISNHSLTVRRNYSAVNILTTTRQDETLEATWREFDLVGKVWTIPAERMKLWIVVLQSGVVGVHRCLTTWNAARRSAPRKTGAKIENRNPDPTYGTMLSLEAIAYEEAGHAVAATILNVPFIDVTISALGGRVRPKGERKFEDRYFLVSLAGPVARLRFDASTAWAAVLDDTAQVKPMFVKAGCEAEYDDLYARTEQFIDAHWPEVERVAQALLTNNMLSPEAVRAAMTHV